MSRIRNTIVIGGALACLFGAFVAWHRWPTDDRTAIARYSAAKCISPSGSRHRTWNEVVHLERGGSVHLESTGEMFSVFELAFSDERYRRQVTSWWDYSYPRDVRISRATNTLWFVVSGGLGGGLSLFDRARLYEYELNARAIVHESNLAPAALPAPCSTSDDSNGAL